MTEPAPNEVVILADVVDPNDPQGRTYRQVNAERMHGIPIGTLVELPSGRRQFVVVAHGDAPENEDGTGPAREIWDVRPIGAARPVRWENAEFHAVPPRFSELFEVLIAACGGEATPPPDLRGESADPEGAESPNPEARHTDGEFRVIVNATTERPMTASDRVAIHISTIITRDQAIAFAREGARHQRHATDSPDWPPQWVIDAVSMAHDSGRLTALGRARDEIDMLRRQVADNFQAGANIAADRERMHLEIADAWAATGDQPARRLERALAEVVARIKSERDAFEAELADRNRDEQVDSDIAVRHAREDAALARQERDVAIAAADAQRAQMQRYRGAGESLSQDLVKRNQEIARLMKWRGSRYGKLEARAKAIGATLAGPGGDEGVIDSTGKWHDLPDVGPDEDELDAVDAVVSRLEAEFQGPESPS